MKYLPKRTAAEMEQPQKKKNMKFHVLMLGGSGPVTGAALIQNIMVARKEQGYPAIDVELNAVDMDIESDSKADLKGVVDAFEPILRTLANQQDTSGILGCLRSLKFHEVNLSQDVYQKTTEEFVLGQVPGHERRSVGVAFEAVAPEATARSELGNGGQGDPLVGYIVAVSHREKIFELIARCVEEARSDPSRVHIILLLNSFNGSAGYNLAPIILQAVTELGVDMEAFAAFDGGLFLAHSAAYSSPDYLGSRDVTSKAADAVNELKERRQLDCLKAGIFMTPINPGSTPYFLCPVNKLKGEQNRHTCIENLIGTKDILDIICGVNRDSERYHYLAANSILTLQRNPDAPDRPLSWGDLDLNGDTYMRLIRMLALGAATRNLIWSRDDNLIANIPAISAILEKGTPLSEVKAAGEVISGACHYMLQQFYDYAVTGTNFEQEHTADFMIADTYRLMFLEAVRKILDGGSDLSFAPGTIDSYVQAIGTEPPFHEKRTKANNLFSSSIKTLIDRIRGAATIEEFYIRLFRTQ